VLGRRVVLIGVLVGVCVGGSIVTAVVLTDSEPRSYTPAEVAMALAMEGLDVSEFGAGEYGSVLIPGGNAFTVLVLGSDRAARRAFDPYQARTDPDTFELLEGNVIVVADGSNSPKPLARATRTKIKRAIEQLRRASS
jgi:hypothetical protein